MIEKKTKDDDEDEDWCLIQFNDGILYGQQLWITSMSLRRFERHYCYYRSIQHRSFFNAHKSDEHRHWCYGCPPKFELGGPMESTHAAVVAYCSGVGGVRGGLLSR